MHKISVIVPVFNTESLLRRCIDSIVSQSYLDWELIVVDDGSTDESGTICDMYAREDERIKVIHTSNNGVSAARNIGIESSTGDYITFVDSDDYIKREMFSSLMSERYSDLVVCGFYNDTMSFVPSDICKGKVRDCIIELIDNPYYMDTPWCKLFKREIIEKNNLRFDPDVRLGEDTLFSYQYLANVNSISAVSQALYYYDGIWGGTQKYQLTKDELLYSSKASIDAINMLSQLFHVDISTKYKCFHFSKLKNLYSTYIDKDVYDMYISTHDYISFPDYMGDFRLSPLLLGLGDVLKNIRMGDKTEAIDRLESISSFVTLPIQSIRFVLFKHKLFCHLWKILGNRATVNVLSLLIR